MDQIALAQAVLSPRASAAAGEGRQAQPEYTPSSQGTCCLEVSEIVMRGPGEHWNLNGFSGPSCA